VDVRPYYDTYWSDNGFRPGADLTPGLRALLGAHVRPGDRCLDIGCGDGSTSGPWLLQRGCDYLGVDVSGTAVAHATAAGLRAMLVDDAASLPFGDGEFDVALAIEVLEHLFSPHLAAAEALRVLRPGGVLIVTVPNVSYWRRRLDLAVLGRWNPFGDDRSVEQPWRDPHIRFFNPGSLRRMLQGAGFAAVRVEGQGGAVVRDLPLARRLWRGRASAAYRAAERRLPGLLGLRVGAVAYKAPSG
jgi:2-polyprenyl-6-hydroxyphenyl methylase/3-demethylubiquinone-9 3-methyltransferase